MRARASPRAHAKGDEAPGKYRRRAASRTARRFAFRITDNGIGLPPEHRHRLTEPYVTTRAKGTGLGLAIVRKIMEDHGGEIALGDARETGEGAEVTPDLPASRKRAYASEEEVKMSKNGSLIASEILVVDDEEDIRDLIAGILQRRRL